MQKTVAENRKLNPTTKPHSLAPKPQPSQIPNKSKPRNGTQKTNKHYEVLIPQSVQDTPIAEHIADQHENKQHETRILRPSGDTPVETPPISKHLRRINIRALVDTIEPILTHPTRSYTPLILDSSNRVDTFFEYSADYSGVFIDAKKYVVETLILKRMTHEDAMEEMRQKLVVALKYGRTLVIRMGDSAADFKKRFTDPKFFPSKLVLVQGGKEMFNETNYIQVVRQQDLEQGTFVVRPDFKVVVTSVFQIEDFDDFLANSFPFALVDELVPIYIEPPAQREQSNVPESLAGYDI